MKFPSLPRLLLLATLTLTLSASAQIVTTQPPVIERSSENIVITFHADRGSKGLMNLPSTTAVYAHTGVIIKGNDQWQYAPNWLDNSEKYRLTYVSPNTYTLTLPSIDAYYGTNPSQEVEKLAFVFRNSDGSREGKTESGGDIFIPVSPDGFSLVIASTPSTTLLQQPGQVAITVNATRQADIRLYVGSTDSEPIAQASGVKELEATYNITTPGATDFYATATADGQTLTERLSLFLVSEAVQQDYPGGVPKMGFEVGNDGNVLFCLAAPEKKSVILMGSWNGYAYDNNQMMHYQDYDGQRYFWTSVSGIADGKDYIYYYIVDGQTAVADPYARLILDPWNDKYIPESVFPDMPDYPSEYVDNTPVGVFNSAIDDYDWQVTEFKGAAQSDLVIYELLIRDFTGTEGASNASGTLEGVRKKLDYLQNLGVNAIEFIPINEFNGNNSWGYNPNFYFAPDKAYGTPDDYRALFDEIHSRGMAVIIDVVFNQTDGQHPWYKMYSPAKNPFYNASAPHAYSVLNDWNQDNSLVQQQFKDMLRYWMEAYKVDGFRFDLVKGLGTNQSYGATYNPSTNTWSGVTDAKTNAFNQSRVDRMKELHEAMREVNPDAYFINENLAGAQEENEMAKDGEINWANINEASCQFAMGYLQNSNTNRFYAPLDSRTWGSTVSYAESHDEERMAYKQQQYGAAQVKGNIPVMMRRLGSVAAMMILTPGSHMIWQFQEFGADQTTKNPDGSNNTDPKRVIWSYLDNPDRAGLMQNYRELIWLRRYNPELFAEGIQTSVSFSTWQQRSLVLKDGTRELLMVINPDVQNAMKITLQGYDSSKTYKLMSASYDTAPTIDGGAVTLQPGAYAVFGTDNLMAIDTIDVDPDASLSAPEYYNLQGVRVLHPNTGLYIMRQGSRTTKVLIP